MTIKLYFLGIFLMATVTGYSQDIQPDESFVLYDPLFWKDQLKLDSYQCQKIREINSEYYQKLLAVAKNEGSQQEVKVKATQSLIERSEEIWETFHPKQRKRWKKIWQDNSPSTQTNET